MNGGVNNPVIFPHVTLGKTLMLNWPGPDNQPLDWPVALYQTTIGTPVTIPVTAVEAPSAYLNEQFNSYGIYDLATKTLTSISATTVRAHNPYNATGGGAQAIVLSDPATGLAMGAYINSPNAGFVFYDNTGGNSPGQTGSSFAKWSVQYYSGVTAGGWTFNTWIVTDKLANVLKDFDQLYAWGVNSR
jgi:hypothetical protein